MDIGSALASKASRKQLRRFAGSLGLGVDDALENLLALEETTVDAALDDVFGASAAAPRAVLAEWRNNGARAAAEPPPPPSPARAVVAAPAPRPPSAPGCCVECGARSDYRFPLLDARLCEGCERLPHYALVTARLATAVHALREGDLRGLRSQDVGGRTCYLRSDVEALAATRATAAAKRRDASDEWRRNTFKTDGAGKTHKWKDLNTATFQKQKANAKHRGLDGGPDVDGDCMDLSGLVRCGDVSAG